MKNKVNVALSLIVLLMLIIPTNIFAAPGIDTSITLGGSNAINSSLSITNKMVGIFQVFGSIISVVALIILGLRYMLSSVDEKASMKGVMVYYIIGAVLVFATSNILGIVYDMITNLE